MEAGGYWIFNGENGMEFLEKNHTQLFHFYTMEL